MALATAEYTIEIWEKNEDSWQKSSEWQAHNGTVLKVRWAHPEYGNLLASCSNDRTVMIWEQRQTEAGMTWARVRDQIAYNDVVEDIQFAPKHQGLQIAVCISNGEIKILEADLSNLASWNPVAAFETSQLGSNCIAWSPSSMHSAMLVVGNNCLEQGSSKFPHVRQTQPEILQLWGYVQKSKQWDKLIVPKNGHSKTVCCVDWAPLMGRRNHMIASSSYDSTIIIWKLSINDSEKDLSIEATLSGHEQIVWRVCWDLLGTCLTSVGDDKKVRVWKRNMRREWIAEEVLD